MPSPSLLLHLPLALFYAYTIYADHSIVYPPELKQVRGSDPYGRLKYLTIWNLFLQFGFFFLSSLASLSSSSKPCRLRAALDFLFTSVVFAASSFVSTSFWGLYAINRELIFPAIFDSFFPDWLNHAMHTLPLLAVSLELLTRKHQLPGKKTGFATAMVFMLIYTAWVHYIAHKTGFWVYPVLEVLPNAARVAFIAAMSVLFGVFYLAGLRLHGLRWGARPAAERVGKQGAKKGAKQGVKQNSKQGAKQGAKQEVKPVVKQGGSNEKKKRK